MLKILALENPDLCWKLFLADELKIFNNIISINYESKAQKRGSDCREVQFFPVDNFNYMHQESLFSNCLTLWLSYVNSLMRKLTIDPQNKF